MLLNIALPKKSVIRGSCFGTFVHGEGNVVIKLTKTLLKKMTSCDFVQSSHFWQIVATRRLFLTLRTVKHRQKSRSVNQTEVFV